MKTLINAIICLLVCNVSLSQNTNMYIYLSNGTYEQYSLNEIDSISYTAPLVSIPVVTCTVFADTSIYASINVVDDGGAPISEVGVCWSTTVNDCTNQQSLPPGQSFFSYVPITGLVNGYTYFVRAFATNSAGTAYSDTSTVVISP